MCCNLKILICFLVLSAALFVVSFVLAFVVFPDIRKNELTKATRLDHGTEQFDRFEETPFALQFRVYIFDVQNPTEILLGSKPNVTEKGPFLYDQYRKKTILDENAEQDTISYTQQLTFEFNKNGSIEDEDYKVTILNPVVVSMYQIAGEIGLGAVVEDCLKTGNIFFPGAIENTNGLFLQLPVRDLLFNGIPFCNDDGTLRPTCKLVCGMAAAPRNIDQVGSHLQFSFLNYKNKPDGIYTISKGIKDINTLGHITLWNNEKYMHYWGEETSTCNTVRGCDSTIYPPEISKEETLSIFSTDICRIVEINYQGEGTYHDINGYQFGTNANTLRSSESDPNLDCFCGNRTKDLDGTESCFLDGVANLNPCVGAPILLSFPHFLWADERYSHTLTGLHPDEDKHKTFLLVEPNTGTPLKGAKRIQLNNILRPIANTMLSQIESALFPLIWVDEGVELPQKFIDELNSSYFNRIKLLEGFKWALIAISTLLTIVFIGLIIRRQLKTR